MDDFLGEFLDEDLLKQAAEEEAKLKAAAEEAPPQPEAKRAKLLLFKPTSVVVVKSKPPTATITTAAPAPPTAAAPPVRYHHQPLPAAPKPPPPPPPVVSAASSSAPSQQLYRLFVGNLSPDVREDAVHKAFNDYKSLAHVQLVMDKNKGDNNDSSKCRGYAFVGFADPFDMLRALREKNGKLCFNRPMHLSKANNPKSSDEADNNKKKM